MVLLICNASRIWVHFFRNYSLQDVVAMIEETDEEAEVTGIFIEPPHGNVSDEDSAEEDSGGLIDNLSSKQLQANAECVLSNGRRIGVGKRYICIQKPMQISKWSRLKMFEFRKERALQKDTTEVKSCIVVGLELLHITLVNYCYTCIE